MTPSPPAPRPSRLMITADTADAWRQACHHRPGGPLQIGAGGLGLRPPRPSRVPWATLAVTLGAGVGFLGWRVLAGLGVL